MADYQISLGMSDGSTIKSNTFSIEGGGGGSAGVSDINSLFYDTSGDDITYMYQNLRFTKDGSTKTISGNTVCFPLNINISYLANWGGDQINGAYFYTYIYGTINSFDERLDTDEITRMFQETIDSISDTTPDEYYMNIKNFIKDLCDGDLDTNSITMNTQGYFYDTNENKLHIYLHGLSESDYFFELGAQTPYDPSEMNFGTDGRILNMMQFSIKSGIHI